MQSPIIASLSSQKFANASEDFLFKVQREIKEPFFEGYSKYEAFRKDCTAFFATNLFSA